LDQLTTAIGMDLTRWREVIEARPVLDPMKLAFPMRDILTMTLRLDEDVVDAIVLDAAGNGATARGTPYAVGLVRQWAYEQLGGMDLDELAEWMTQMSPPDGMGLTKEGIGTTEIPLSRVANAALSAKLKSDV